MLFQRENCRRGEIPGINYLDFQKNVLIFYKIRQIYHVCEWMRDIFLRIFCIKFFYTTNQERFKKRNVMQNQ